MLFSLLERPPVETYITGGRDTTGMDTSKIVEDPIPEKTCVVVGTRPGIIKMSPLIDELQSRDVESFVIHTGQHYSNNLSNRMFEDLRLPAPEYHLNEVKEAYYHGEQTAAMLTGIEEALLEERPENVLICGDANFNLAGALATRKLRLNLGHVEAGLRSGDWRMPEEHNRVMIDHISDYLFAPTETAKQNALEDNVQGEISVVGNTIVDAVYRNREIASDSTDVLERFGLEGEEYIVLTAHREENVDDEATLREIVEIVELINRRTDYKVIFSVHPRTIDRLESFNLKDRLIAVNCLTATDPMGYLEFLTLLEHAMMTITDSGGIQEEACILGVPCITIRENTERPETIEVGANVVAGTDPESVLDAVSEAGRANGDWENPFGDGNAAKRIVDVLLNGSR